MVKDDLNKIRGFNYTGYSYLDMKNNQMHIKPLIFYFYRVILGSLFSIS